MKNKQYRQGDVMIERVSEIPKEAKKLPVGRVILAYGEVTGHHHSFAANEVESFKAEDGCEYFNVKGKPLQWSLPVVRSWRNQVMVKHPSHGFIEFAESDVVIESGKVIVDGSFSLLFHGNDARTESDHTMQGIPAALYKGGSAGRSIQREYSPEEIRNVAD
jgi:hypothetical protein